MLTTLKQNLKTYGLTIGFILSLVSFPLTGCAAYEPQEGFTVWVEEFKQEAHSQGISQQTLDEAFAGVEPLPRVLELDQKQPEKTQTFVDYVHVIVSPERVRLGQEMWRRHRVLIKQIADQYDVDPAFIVALWGIETNFGRQTGGFQVIPALATLAYEGQRKDFFRQELLKALRIAERGDISLKDMTGSWAGAMGQNQFMPSTYLAYAVDGNQDGRADIWGTEADVFASTAQYLSKLGWQKGQAWGVEVRLPIDLDAALIGLETRKTMTEWGRLGIRLLNDQQPLPMDSTLVSLVAPDGPGGRAFLIYGNYRALMAWNRSTYFATAVGLLADQLTDDHEG